MSAMQCRQNGSAYIELLQSPRTTTIPVCTPASRRSNGLKSNEGDLPNFLSASADRLQVAHQERPGFLASRTQRNTSVPRRTWRRLLWRPLATQVASRTRPWNWHGAPHIRRAAMQRDPGAAPVLRFRRVQGSDLVSSMRHR